jgi:hypothetical protein
MAQQPADHSVPIYDLGESDTLKQIARSIYGLRYGSVEITVHAGRVVQLERREKTRLEAALPEIGKRDQTTG